MFNTFEGGAIISSNKQLKDLVDNIINFGIVSEIEVSNPGINGKMNEFQAALGLLQLKYIYSQIEKRKNIDYFYREHIKLIDGLTVPHPPSSKKHNFHYFPILVEDNYNLNRDELYYLLKSKNVLARRYFYPLLSDLKIFSDENTIPHNQFPAAKAISDKVICLPIHSDLDNEDLEYIISILRC